MVLNPILSVFFFLNLTPFLTLFSTHFVFHLELSDTLLDTLFDALFQFLRVSDHFRKVTKMMAARDRIRLHLNSGIQTPGGLKIVDFRPF